MPDDQMTRTRLDPASKPGRKLGVRRWAPVAAAFFVVAVSANFLLSERISSESVDIAGHYALVDFYSSLWGSKEQFDKMHPVVAHYPALSHIFAALISLALEVSPFLGMQIASVVFVGTTYVVLFFGALSRNLSAGFGTIAASVLTFYVFWSRHLFFGHELAGNFFFAQVGGTTVMIATLFALSNRERNRTELFAIPAIVFLLGWLYPLPQIQVAAGAVSLWLMTAAKAAMSRSADPRKYIVGALVITALSIAAFRLHPLYSSMRVVSDNNGEIFAKISFPALCVAAAILLIASCVIAAQAIQNRSNLMHPQFLAAAGFGLSLSFAAHAVVYALTSAGSDYAIRKHAYSIVTVTVIQLFAIAAQSMFGRQKSLLSNGLFAIYATTIVSVASVFAVWITLSRQSKNIGDFLSVQSQVRSLAASDSSLYEHSAAQLPNLSGIQNSIITTVDLRVVDDVAYRISVRREAPADHNIFRCIAIRERQLQAGDCAK